MSEITQGVPGRSPDRKGLGNRTGSPSQEEARAAVDFVLTTNGLPVTDEERERLVATYPAMREMVAALRIPEVRYGDPAMVYPATLDR
jgi:hypothetical protein